jgi:cysteinyl-tRNA synthetase
MFCTLGFVLPSLSPEEEVETGALVLRRKELREKGEFKEADRIRSDLMARKVRLVDRKDGTYWMKVETLQ